MSKALTIQKTTQETVDKFHAQRAEFGLNPAQYFEQLLNNTVNPVNNNSLQEKVTELETSLQSLQQINESLQNDKQSLLEINKQLTLQLEETTNSKLLTGTQFIFEPTEMQAKKMQRSIAYLKNKGKLDLINKDKYLQHFTNIALEYLINNEFNHILK